MQRLEGRFVYSASDLNDYLECKRLAELEMLVACGKLARPAADDEQLELIKEKGQQHEARYLAALRERNVPDDIVCFTRSSPGVEAYSEAERQTLDAMKRGARIIYQATFFDGTFLGHADFLRRVDTPSPVLGAWSYEVIDTKLALTSKPYFIVQICNYSEHLSRLQGVMPEHGYIVLGDGTEDRFRLNDYAAYYRHLKASFLEHAGAAEREAGAAEYPYKRGHCGICRWNDTCTEKRRDDDHLSLVAWMRRDQVEKFESSGIENVETLATATNRPDGMAEETFARLRRQARLQVEGRSRGRNVYEIVQPEPASGFALLPEPAEGDIFFDIEGDPFYEPARRLEYLFGFWVPGEEPRYRAFWAAGPDEEKERFQEVVDFITERRCKYPQMHVYHYAPYETTALKHLKQQYFTHEEAVDDLLRGEVFVDLYAVVRQALVLSTESYGLKKVEAFYDVRRETQLKKGDESVVMFERWLQERDPALRSEIEAYNSDDCRSTYLLREWLMERRSEAIARYGEIAFRPVLLPKQPCHAEYQERCKSCEKRRKEEREEQRRSEIERRLLDDPRPGAKLLAHLVAYHRREAQPGWWTFYHRRDNVDQLLEFDREAMAGLQLCDDCPPEREKQSYVYTYVFAEQTHKMEPGVAIDPRTARSVTILQVDDDRFRLRLKTTASLAEARSIKELIPRGPYDTSAQQAALECIGEAFVSGTLQRDFPATADLLAARDPRPGGILQPECVTAESVSAAVARLAASYIFVQGPPGSGKSTIGAQVICDLLAGGKRVAIMSTGHKANHNLLGKVEACMAARGKRFEGMYKHSEGDSRYLSLHGFVESVDSNERFAALDYQLAGGTAWLFSRPELKGAFDYLFIDEAGQVSLADALAVSTCAKNVVLLGDPAQLAQVSQASHPMDEASTSVLEHLLGDAQTVPPHRGIFLDVSYRMQPEICAFISDAMYEGRLRPSPDTASHAIVDGRRHAGLWFIPVAHDGNGSKSPEEADRIVGEIVRLLLGCVIDSQPASLAGVERPMLSDDVIVVTPYNAQRRLIRQKLRAAGLDVKVGTVDKVQGQEAAVVFYSMATSSGDDVPRDIKFLFERNRFNVAISRARALSVLVCSPRLLDAACNSAEEMALVNLLCGFAERTGSSELELQAATGKSPS